MKLPECDYDIPKKLRPFHCPRPIPSDPIKRKPLDPKHAWRTSPQNMSIILQAQRGNVRAHPYPNTTKLLCLAGTENMAPHLNGEVYWQPWDSANSTTGSNQQYNGTRLQYQYDLRFSCHEDNEKNLICTRGNWGPKR